MKIYISTDMEGIPGTFNWEQEKTNRPEVLKKLSNTYNGLSECYFV